MAGADDLLAFDLAPAARAAAARAAIVAGEERLAVAQQHHRRLVEDERVGWSSGNCAQLRDLREIVKPAARRIAELLEARQRSSTQARP